jgi:asparagine synthase (glutamine-hydrolysing)
MCGLAGYFAFGGRAQPVDVMHLLRMRDRMTRRGPDGAGLWIANDRRVGLAHRRLSIIDLTEAAAQPMASHDGRLHIVFNGEIYNFADLKADLQRDGAVFSTHSDTEVLLHLYDRHGPAMLSRLRGMFAFVIYDTRERSLFLARDLTGIKPLYFAEQDGCFRFASQVKALLEDPAISRDISPAGLTGFHVMGSVPEPFTIYRAIHALPAGHWLKVTTRGAEAPQSYGSIANILTQANPEGVGQAEIRSAMLDCVKAHLVSDVEVGAFLSGGVDSAALVGLMRECGQDRIRTCTLSFAEFEGEDVDELPGAIDIARHYGVDHHNRRVDLAEFEASQDDIFDQMDQPTVDGINSWFVCKAVAEMGLKVALSGAGGDELLAGYSTFTSIPRTHRWFGPLGRVRSARAPFKWLARALLPNLVDKNPKILGLLDYSDSWASTYILRRAVLLPFELDGVMDPEIAKEGLAELNLAELLSRSISPMPGSDNGRICALEMGSYLRNQLLRDADWTGMAHSVEVRVPYADADLLKAVAPALPGLKPGDGKFLLGHCPKPAVPASIVNRPKTGFSIPIGDWLRHSLHHVDDRRTSRKWSRTVDQEYRASIQPLPLEKLDAPLLTPLQDQVTDWNG